MLSRKLNIYFKGTWKLEFSVHSHLSLRMDPPRRNLYFRVVFHHVTPTGIRIRITDHDRRTKAKRIKDSIGVLGVLSGK